MAQPTPRQILIKKAAESLAPDKSIERLNDLSKLLLGQIALVGTVLGGLGAFTDVGSELADSEGWLIAAFLLGLVSIASSLVALLPQQVFVNPSNITQLEAVFQARMTYKYRLVWLGFLTLILAVGSAAWPTLESAIGGDEPTVQASIGRNVVAGSEGPVEVIQSSAKLRNLPEGAVVHAVVSMSNADPLATRRVVVDESGSVDVEIESSTGGETTGAAMTVTATDRDEQIVSVTVELD
ncbi:MAG TPA: hypothetical protein VMR52_03265 [Dehalococcoidia bacterium]|nr:hypothetical protein [Dehalococcoidia bacterium]